MSDLFDLTLSDSAASFKEQYEKDHPDVLVYEAWAVQFTTLSYYCPFMVEHKVFMGVFWLQSLRTCPRTQGSREVGWEMRACQHSQPTLACCAMNANSVFNIRIVLTCLFH